MIKYERYRDQLKEKGLSFHRISKNLYQCLHSRNSPPNGEERNKKTRERIKNFLYSLAKEFLRENKLPYSSQGVKEVMGYISKEAHEIKKEENGKRKEHIKNKGQGLEGKL